VQPTAGRFDDTCVDNDEGDTLVAEDNSVGTLVVEDELDMSLVCVTLSTPTVKSIISPSFCFFLVFLSCASSDSAGLFLEDACVSPTSSDTVVTEFFSEVSDKGVPFTCSDAVVGVFFSDICVASGVWDTGVRVFFSDIGVSSGVWDTGVGVFFSDIGVASRVWDTGVADFSWEFVDTGISLVEFDTCVAGADSCETTLATPP
jgi:hypothetical protein